METFVVRVWRSTGDEPLGSPGLDLPLRGLVEHIGSAKPLPFQSGGELLGILESRLVDAAPPTGPGDRVRSADSRHGKGESGMRTIGIVVALSLGAATGLVAQEGTRFDSPAVEGVAVDWCLAWGADCGQPAADRYCRDHGSPAATDFALAEDVGRTVIQSTGQLCEDPRCDGFAYIECRAAASGPLRRIPPAPETGFSNQREIFAQDKASGRAVLIQLTPDGGLLETVDYGTTWKRQYEALAPADFNGDGRLDLLLWDPERTALDMVRFDEKGRIAYADQAMVLLWTNPSCETGDFNGDGRGDGVCLDPGSGTLRTLQFDDSGVLSLFREIDGYPFQGRDLILGSAYDMNGDGRDELVVEEDGAISLVSFSDSLDAFEGNVAAGIGAPFRTSFGDFDGDGLRELVVIQIETGALAMHHLGPDLQVTRRTELPPEAPSVRIYKYTWDWDGDGRNDLVLKDQDSGDIRIVRFDADGAVIESTPVLEGITGESYIGEYTADGRPSFLLIGPGGDLRLARVGPDLRAVATNEITSLWTEMHVSSADFDGD
jgi:hypothetical protein